MDFCKAPARSFRVWLWEIRFRVHSIIGPTETLPSKKPAIGSWHLTPLVSVKCSLNQRKTRLLVPPTRPHIAKGEISFSQRPKHPKNFCFEFLSPFTIWCCSLSLFSSRPHLTKVLHTADHVNAAAESLPLRLVIFRLQEAAEDKDNSVSHFAAEKVCKGKQIVDEANRSHGEGGDDVSGKLFLSLFRIFPHLPFHPHGSQRTKALRCL